MTYRDWLEGERVRWASHEAALEARDVAEGRAKIESRPWDGIEVYNCPECGTPIRARQDSMGPIRCTCGAIILGGVEFEYERERNHEV